MKRALVTGHAGLTGTHLASHLRSSGYFVSGFDRSHGGDIRDQAIARFVRTTRPTVVFHLAAALKSQDPEELYAVNVLRTVALLDALVKLEDPRWW
jgi:nucleoside-diphosphate-sugar epimerase